MDDFKCLVSNNRAVKKSNCTGKERHPVSFLVAAGLVHYIAKGAPLNAQFHGGDGKHCP